jgi:hypothetical protein
MQVWVDKALVLLTDAQVARWRAMTGQPLDNLESIAPPSPH